MGTGATKPGNEHRCRHERGPDDRWACAREDHVPTDRGRSDERGRPAPTRVALQWSYQGRDQGGHDRDIPARDRDYVCEACRREGVVDLRSYGCANAEEDSRAQGGFRFGHHRIQATQQCSADADEDCRGPGRGPHDFGEPRTPDCSDSLPPQVLAIREAIEVLCQLDPRSHSQAIATADVDATRHPNQQPIGEFQWPTVEHRLNFADDDLDSILARPRVVHDGADQFVLIVAHEGCHRRLGSRT